MKYIAKYARNNIEIATLNHSCSNIVNISSGHGLGRFVNTEHGIREAATLGKIKDKWLKILVDDLFANLKLHGKLNYLSLYDTTIVCKKHHKIMHIKEGHTLYTKRDGKSVLAETCVSYDGCAVVVIHREHESTLYVNARTVSNMADNYKKKIPLEVIMYESTRTDEPWYEPNPEELDQKFYWHIKHANRNGAHR